MLSDIIADVVSVQPDMQIVGTVEQHGAMVAAARSARPDVVVIGLEDSELPETCGPLFEAFPRIRVLGVASDGRGASLYELRPRKTSLGEVSPEGLVQAIRGSARSWSTDVVVD